MKILKKEKLFTTKYLDLVEIEYLNKNNKNSIWYSAERSNGGKAVIIAAIMDNKLVVTKEFRVPIGDYEWGLPAGLVDNDESPEQTAKRELKEETNLDIETIKEITPYLYNSAGMSNEAVSFVFCRATGTIDNSGNELSEDIQCFLMDAAQLKEIMNEPGNKISAKAYLIFRKFIDGGIWFGTFERRYDLKATSKRKRYNIDNDRCSSAGS